MISPPPWMYLAEPDPRQSDELPGAIGAMVRALEAAGVICAYAGSTGAQHVYLLRDPRDPMGRRRGRLLDVWERGGLELWVDPPDPNGAPDAWGHYSPPSSDGSAEGAQLVSSFWS